MPATGTDSQEQQTPAAPRRTDDLGNPIDVTGRSSGPTIAQVSLTAVSPLLIFDGDCGFCTAAAHKISLRWTEPARAQPWQALGPAALNRIGLTEYDVRQAAYWVDEHGRVFRGHAAVGKALLAGRGTDRMIGTVLLIPPVSWLARPLYWLVARYRHRLPGATDACRL